MTRASSHNDKHHTAVALNNLGMARVVRNRFDEALPYFERVLTMTSLGDDIAYGTSLTNAGLCYARLGDFDRAIALQRRAVSTHETRSFRQYLLQALGELGNTYIQKGDSRLQCLTSNVRSTVARDAGLTRDAALWAGNLASAYTELREWDARSGRTPKRAG